MWGTLLVLALAATADPVRLGVSVLLCSRPRPVPNLVACWVGGVMTSIVLALGMLCGLRDFMLGIVHRAERATTSAAAGHLQIAMGLLALTIAALTVGLSSRQRARMGMPGVHPSPLPASPLQALTSTAFSRMSTRVHHALQVRPLWVAFVLGVGLLADFRCLAALAAIVASGAAITTQFSAAAVYACVSLAFLEIPLVIQLVAPARCGRFAAQVHSWAKARRQQVFAALVGVLGVVLMTAGMGTI